MENASKALIIAGANLLSILIISLGIIVFQNAKGATDTSSVDGLAVDTFNSKFIQYTGNKVKGANVNALLEAIVSNNLTNTEDKSKQIEISLDNTIVTADGANKNWNKASSTVAADGKATDIKQVGAALTGKAYSVSFEYDSDSGYVNKCLIKKAQ